MVSFFLFHSDRDDALCLLAREIDDIGGADRRKGSVVEFVGTTLQVIHCSIASSMRPGDLLLSSLARLCRGFCAHCKTDDFLRWFGGFPGLYFAHQK